MARARPAGGSRSPADVPAPHRAFDCASRQTPRIALTETRHRVLCAQASGHSGSNVVCPVHSVIRLQARPVVTHEPSPLRARTLPQCASLGLIDSSRLVPAGPFRPTQPCASPLPLLRLRMSHRAAVREGGTRLDRTPPLDRPGLGLEPRPFFIAGTGQAIGPLPYLAQGNEHPAPTARQRASRTTRATP